MRDSHRSTHRNTFIERDNGIENSGKFCSPLEGRRYLGARYMRGQVYFNVHIVVSHHIACATSKAICLRAKLEV